MIRRSNARDRVHTVRILLGLAVIGGYVVLRLPLVVSPLEVGLTWIGAVLCGGIVITSAEELALRRIFREQRPDSAWPTEVDLMIAEAREAALNASEITHQLFTHDILCEPTPPRGIALPDTEYRQTKRALLREAYTPPASYVGRHRLADAQLNRDRTGPFFGML